MGEPAAEQWDLSLLGFDMLWTLGGLGAFPLVLQLKSQGATFAERDEIMRSELPALQRTGAVRDGVVDGPLQAAMLALARPDTEVDLRGLSRDRVWRALGALQADRGVLVVKERDRIRLQSVPSEQLVPELVSTLGELRPGPPAQLNVDGAMLQAALQRAGGDETALVGELARVGVEHSSAQELANVLTANRGRAAIGTAHRMTGHRKRNPHVVVVLDGERGRYVSITTGLADGRQFVTIRPARSRDVIDAVQKLASPTSRSAPDSVLRRV